MGWGARKADRVTFAKGIATYIMAIDGTWRRNCTLLDISATGARINLEGSFEELALKEFFLLLSATGVAFRRCSLVRIQGDELGLKFVEAARAKKSAGAASGPA